MSKSLGNTTTPQEVIEQSGADILRLWVVGSDYSEDLRIGPEILKHHADLYRRLRNTLRFLLGSLADFSPEERVDPADMPELERWVLHRLWELNAVVRRESDNFDFHDLFIQLHHFCAVDLSAFYFDIRKDALYCDARDDLRRRATRTVLDQVFRASPRGWRRFWCSPPRKPGSSVSPIRPIQCTCGPIRKCRPRGRRRIGGTLGAPARSAPSGHRRA